MEHILSGILFVLIIVALVVTYRSHSACSRMEAAIVEAQKNDSQIDRIMIIVDENKKLGEATHALVNSNMGSQLLLTHSALRRVAMLTKDSEDIKAAEDAAELYRKHQGKQDVVDAGRMDLN